MIPRFDFARCPRIHFGPGTFKSLGDIINCFGKKVLVVTGARSFQSSSNWDVLMEIFSEKSIDHSHLSVEGEPSPDLVDSAVSDFREEGVDVVLSIGGGSAIDSGKAVSAMLPHDASVLDFIEGVGKGITHSGIKIPFIAVPTTSGTGSEATKNSVLSRVGEKGFKRSLRHDNFIPDVALVDPELMLSCPPGVTASCGMDAFTQLLESYVSKNSNPLTDALAYSGLEFLRDNLVPACTDGADSVEVRAGMAYASLLSGITLTNAGLGVVHGFASAIGGLFDIPHGVVCGTLVGPATETNIESLRKKGASLEKFACIGALLSVEDTLDVEKCCLSLIDHIEEWVEALGIPRLSEYGIEVSDADRILYIAGQKDNPVELSKDEMREILLRRI